MRKYLPLLFLLCGCTLPDRAFVEAVDKSWATISTEYTAYVDADPAIDGETKALRKDTAAGLTALIEKAQKAVQP